MTDTLLQDLAGYKKHRDKGVMMGARSLIGLFRDINPELLAKKDRVSATSPTTARMFCLESFKRSGTNINSYIYRVKRRQSTAQQFKHLNSVLRRSQLMSRVLR